MSKILKALEKAQVDKHMSSENKHYVQNDHVEHEALTEAGSSKPWVLHGTVAFLMIVALIALGFYKIGQKAVHELSRNQVTQQQMQQSYLMQQKQFVEMQEKLAVLITNNDKKADDLKSEFQQLTSKLMLLDSGISELTAFIQKNKNEFDALAVNQDGLKNLIADIQTNNKLLMKKYIALNQNVQELDEKIEGSNLASSQQQLSVTREGILEGRNFK